MRKGAGVRNVKMCSYLKELSCLVISSCPKTQEMNEQNRAKLPVQGIQALEQNCVCLTVCCNSPSPPLTPHKTSQTWRILPLGCKESRIQGQEAFRDVTLASSFDSLKWDDITCLFLLLFVHNKRKSCTTQ